MQRGGELVFLAPGLHHHRRTRDGLGERRGRQPHRLVPAAEGVVGVGVAQLGHRADVAGVEPLDLDSVPPLLHRQVVQLLHRLVLGVPHLVAILDGPAVEPEQRHVAHVGLAHGLEYVTQEGRTLVAFQPRHRALERRREQLHHFGEQRPHPVGELPAAAEERDHLT